MREKRSRVWLLDGSVAMTGAFISAREMARIFRDDIDFVLVLPRGSTIKEGEMCDFRDVHYLPIRPLKKTFSGVLLYIPYLIFSAIYLRILLLRDGASLLFVNDFYLMQGALLRLLGYGGKIVTWVRISPAAFGRISRVWLWCASRSSQSVVAVSHYIQRMLPKSIISTLIYDPVSIEFIPAPSPSGKVNPCFVFIGNYIQGKGQDVALEAMAQVLESCPDARLEFYGGDMGLEKNRTYRRMLELRSEQLGLGDAVHFGDMVSSPRAVLLGKRAALNLSKSESFPRTVLEASACGVPVIATRCGGPEEIVDDGRTGFLIPIGDFRQCAFRMLDLCESPELASQMGAAGRYRVMSAFRPEAFKAEILDMLGVS